MTFLKPAAAGLALAALIAGAAVAGGDKTKTSTMSGAPAATGKASDTAAMSRMTPAEREKMRACKAMSATAMAADAECRRLSDKHPGKAGMMSGSPSAAKPSASGAAATGAPPQ